MRERQSRVTDSFLREGKSRETERGLRERFLNKRGCLERDIAERWREG